MWPSRALLAVALASTVSFASAAESAVAFMGCYQATGDGELGSLKLAEQKVDFNSKGKCREICVTNETNAGRDGFAVEAMTKGDSCYCGNKLPNDDYKVDDGFCKAVCPGFDKETCGHRSGEYFSVYITGLEKDPDKDPKSSTSSSSSSTPTTTSSTSTVEPTVVVTESAVVESTAPKKKSGVNKGGVAAGVVVAILVIVAIVGVALFYVRKRRREKVEEQFRRSAAVREFTQKPASDHRLDPGMVQRRDSVGSIADNQDYSRKILRITNPDG